MNQRIVDRFVGDQDLTFILTKLEFCNLFLIQVSKLKVNLGLEERSSGEQYYTGPHDESSNQKTFEILIKNLSSVSQHLLNEVQVITEAYNLKQPLYQCLPSFEPPKT